MRFVLVWLCLATLCAAQPPQQPKGPPPARKTVKMPSLTGVKLEEARARLKEAHLPEPTVAYAEGTEGLVVRQIPASGQEMVEPLPTPRLFVGRAKLQTRPSALATPVPPKAAPRGGTNWLVLAVTAVGLFLGVSALAARWGLAAREGEVRITRRGRRK